MSLLLKNMSRSCHSFMNETSQMLHPSQDFQIFPLRRGDHFVDPHCGIATLKDFHHYRYLPNPTLPL